MFFFFYIENGILCVFIRIASNEAILMRKNRLYLGDSNENAQHTFMLWKIEEILIMPPDLVLSSTLIGSNYPCLELIFMVPKLFEPLKFDCSSNSDKINNVFDF